MSVNGLEKITEKILADARAQADALLAQAREDADRISAEYEARADEIRVRLTTEAERRGEDMVRSARSAVAMQKRDLLLEQRSGLIDSVFVSAKDWVLSLPAEKYADLLGGLLASAMVEMADADARNLELYGEALDGTVKYEILLNKRDRDAVGALVLETAAKKLKNKLNQSCLDSLMLSPDTAPIDGGVILRAGEIEFNCSIGMLFAQLQRELEGEVAAALFAPRGQNA